MPYDNTNKGSLHANQKKTQDTHPGATGSAEIQCPCCNTVTAYFVDAWTNTAKDSGNRYQSLKFKVKDKQPAKQAKYEPTKPLPPKDPDLDPEADSLPF